MTDYEISDWMLDAPLPTAEERAELPSRPRREPVRSWWNLPMAADMWAADARDIEDADGW